MHHPKLALPLAGLLHAALERPSDPGKNRLDGAVGVVQTAGNERAPACADIHLGIMLGQHPEVLGKRTAITRDIRPKALDSWIHRRRPSRRIRSPNAGAASSRRTRSTEHGRFADIQPNAAT